LLVNKNYNKKRLYMDTKFNEEDARKEQEIKGEI